MIRAKNTKVGQKGHLPSEIIIFQSGTKISSTVRNNNPISATNKSHQNLAENQGQKRARNQGQNNQDQAHNRLSEAQNSPIGPISVLEGHYDGSFTKRHKTVPEPEVSPEPLKTGLMRLMDVIVTYQDRPKNRSKNAQKLRHNGKIHVPTASAVRHPQTNSESSNELFGPKTARFTRIL